MEKEEEEEPHDSAWTLDEESDEYSLSGGGKEVRWPRLRVPLELYDRLYDHQKVGVQWMGSLHVGKIGGILGDDMGLGKTFQTLTYLGGLMRARTIRNALVLCPVSLLRTWENEARDIIDEGCGLSVTISVISSDVKKSKRTEMLRSALTCSSKRPHLAITTYGLVASDPVDFVCRDYDSDDGDLYFDYVVLDEGHKIKNPSTKASKACHRICRGEGTRRLLLTGTPIQNNLKELWALFDWATSGRVLGKLPNFMNYFGQPIEEGRHKNAKDYTIQIAEKANRELQEKLRPYFLQRLKSVEFRDELPEKREIVVWTHLSEEQRKMYAEYVEHGGNVKSILAGEISSPLEAITWLKKLCGHPSLVLWNKDSWELLKNDVDVDRKKLVRNSAKLRVLVDLLKRLSNSGHRTLVFSQSTKMLDIIQRVLEPMPMFRIDGGTKEKQRQRIVDRFNNRESEVDVMLLSTKAAGLGLTLTGADRCVVYDPSWNPAEDSQAVDRCFRIGQLKKVTVYRFIAAGTVEERMYEKQVFKDGIRRTVMSNTGSNTQRYFNKDELRRLFQLAPAGECEMLARFQGETTTKAGSGGDETDPTNSSFVVGASGKPSFLEVHRCVVGISSHDHLYTDAVPDSGGAGANGHNAPQTPFAGTPLRERKMGRAGRVLAGKKLDFTNTKRSTRDDPRANAVPVRKENHARDSNSLVHVVTKTPQTKESNKENIPKSTNTQLSKSFVRSPDLKPTFEDVDYLIGQNQLDQAMGLLLDELDVTFKFREKEEKLQIHKKIAALGTQLGWL